MALRISTERRLGAPTIIRVAGRLADDAVDVLMGACVGMGPVTIDLSEVHYADDAGVKALWDLRTRGATLHRPRPYLALLL